MTQDKNYRRRWTRIDGRMVLPLPMSVDDGGIRYAVALVVAGAGCPCEEGRAECVWAAIFGGPDEGETGIGAWVDLLRDWHHTTVKSARLAIEDWVFPDVNDVRKALRSGYTG